MIAIHWRTEEIRPNLEAFALSARDHSTHRPLSNCTGGTAPERYGPAAAEELAPRLLRFEQENQLGYLSSPEFFPYNPSWGRMSTALAQQLRDAIALIGRLEQQTTGAEHRKHLAVACGQLPLLVAAGPGRAENRARLRTEGEILAGRSGGGRSGRAGTGCPP